MSQEKQLERHNKAAARAQADADKAKLEGEKRAKEGETTSARQLRVGGRSFV